MDWDPRQYGRFAGERGRPFDDLLARIGARAPRRVVAVLEWLGGTGLRPVLAALPADRLEPFTADFAAALRTAYPPHGGGTLFPFRRIFAVGHRPGQEAQA